MPRGLLNVEYIALPGANLEALCKAHRCSDCCSKVDSREDVVVGRVALSPVLHCQLNLQGGHREETRGHDARHHQGGC